MKHLLICVLLSYSSIINAQHTLFTAIKGHSHNDYYQKQPFQTAFEAGMESIEADICLWNNDLYVAHTFFEIDESCNFDALYLQPLVHAFRTGKGYPLQLMLDVKSNAELTLKAIIKSMRYYPDVFNEKSPIKIIISGNRPTPSVWNTFPAFVLFDGRPNEDYTPEQWQRIGMVSDNFNHYKSWFSRSQFCPTTCSRLRRVLNFVHAKGKKMRFWKTPDNQEAWEILSQLGVDYVNTDFPSKLRLFLYNKTKSEFLAQSR